MTNILELREAEEVLIDFDDSNCPTPATLISLESVGVDLFPVQGCSIARFKMLGDKVVAVIVNRDGTAWCDRGEVLVLSQADCDSQERWQGFLTGVKAHFANGGS